MVSRTIRNLLIMCLILAAAAFSVLFLCGFSENRSLSQDLFLDLDEDTSSIAGPEPVGLIRSILASIAPEKEYSPITLDYPFNKSVFPPEIVAPTFLWHDPEKAADLWLIDITFKDNPFHIYALTTGKQVEPQIDPAAVSSTNEDYRRSDYELSAKAWTPDERSWNTVKRNCVEAFGTVTIIGLRSPASTSFAEASGSKPEILSRASMQLIVSKDPVGTPIFYRDVPLMPSETSTGVIKPIAKEALPLIVWRLRDISKPSAPVVLKDMPTCVNCHTFSRDGKVLGMDMDGPTGDKGAYALTKVKKNTVIATDNIITWNSYRYSPKGHMNFGLFSHVSPNGKYVISTLNESTFVANYPDFRFLQSFYPTRGIFVVYYSDTGRMEPLPGANDPNYVHTNACWSPDGRNILFSRAKAKDNYETKVMPKHVNDPNETFIQYDLYTMPFNNGKGGLPTPLAGASQNGMSNSFSRYSPDGKWIVFVQTNKGQLMRPDSKLYIIPAQGGNPRKMSCNLPLMNSWHSWSPNGRWLVFSSKGFTPFTQMFLTHVDENGNDSPAILIPNSTAANRAVNIPEFLYNSVDAIVLISTPVQDSYRHFKKSTELTYSGKYAEALEELEKSLLLNPYYAKAHNERGVVLLNTGRHQESIACFERAIQLDPELAIAYSNYGFVLALMGQTDKAISMYSRALEIDSSSADVLNNAAQLLQDTGRLEEAEPMMRRAVEIWGKSFGYKHPNVASALNNLAGLLMKTGRLEEAEAMYRRVVKILENPGGAPLPNYAGAMNNLARLLQDTGRLEEAEPMYRRALEIDESRFGQVRPDGVAICLDNLAQLLHNTGRLKEAEVMYRRALKIFEESFGPGHWRTKNVRENLEKLMKESEQQTKDGGQNAPH